MALIKCPECGKEISDRADFCPNCGYPISKYQACPDFSLELFFCDEKYYMGFKKICGRLYGYDRATSMIIVESARKSPAIIAENLSEEDARSAHIWFKANHILTRIMQDGKETRIPGDDAICCPMCGSQQFTALNQGTSASKVIAGALVAGVVGIAVASTGAGKVQYVCLKCGYKF